MRARRAHPGMSALRDALLGAVGRTTELWSADAEAGDVRTPHPPCVACRG